MDAGKTVATKRVDTKKIATLAMMSALAFAVMAVSKLLPSVQGFLDFDFKDVVICIAGFVYGPLSALGMIVVVCLLEMLSPFSSSGIIGFVMNVIATAAFCCPACYIYKKNHTMKGAVTGLVVGLVLLIVTMLAWNYFITPLYMGVSRDYVASILLSVFLPFNAVKGGLNLTATLLLYKPVVGALRKAKLMPESTGGSAPVQGRKKVGETIVVLFVFVSCVLFALSLQGII